MQKPLGTLLKKRFFNAMREKVPSFHRESITQFGSVIYRRGLAPNLNVFICLVASSNRDEFTIEVAWSRKVAYPIETFTFLPTDPPENDSLRLRLSRLWEPNGMEHWWKFTKSRLDTDYREEVLKELIPKVEPFVEDAVEKITRFAIPYFNTLT